MWLLKKLFFLLRSMDLKKAMFLPWSSFKVLLVTFSPKVEIRKFLESLVPHELCCRIITSKNPLLWYYSRQLCFLLENKLLSISTICPGPLIWTELFMKWKTVMSLQYWFQSAKECNSCWMSVLGIPLDFPALLHLK